MVTKCFYCTVYCNTDFTLCKVFLGEWKQEFIYLLLIVNQVIVSLEEAHGLAAEREGVGRVLYDFVARSSLELSLHKVTC